MQQQIGRDGWWGQLAELQAAGEQSKKNAEVEKEEKDGRWKQKRRGAAAAKEKGGGGRGFVLICFAIWCEGGKEKKG